MTSRERACALTNEMIHEGHENGVCYSEKFIRELQGRIEQAIIADRQALRFEIEGRLRKLLDCSSDYSEDFRKAFTAGAYQSICEVQSVFAQPDQMEALKKCGKVFRNLYETEKHCTLLVGHAGSHMNTEFDPSCSTCVREAKEEAEENAKTEGWGWFDAAVEKKTQVIIGGRKFVPESDQSNRIAALHEWLATDAKIIQQLNESNQRLSEKIAQLEKEKHELTQKLEASYDHVCVSYCDACKSPANRKV